LQSANRLDLEAAQTAGLAPPLVDRLKLTPAIIATVAEGCEQIAAMPDPIGEISGLLNRPSGIAVGRMRVPLGVFGMVYESRPNVTIEAASLAIKSGNACILRGGSEALHSNLALWRLVQAALVDAGVVVVLPSNCWGDLWHRADGATGACISGCSTVWEMRPTCQSWVTMRPPLASRHR
jgi:glutamate-5-semialdehyde dehydrogenase